ncbi:hypothetical protein BH23THE1_BH23THE1_29590 [soil metagenome]
MHSKNFKHLQGIAIYLMRPTLDWGFNIITEKKEKRVDDNPIAKSRYESGETSQEHKNGCTDDAIICQSILQYSIVYGTEKFFKSRQISQDHLLLNCEVYTEIYSGSKANTPIKARAENINQRVVNFLDILEYLGLVVSQTVQTLNNEQTRVYRFTALGQIIGSLLSYNSPGNKNTNIQTIYNQIQEYYSKLVSSAAIFCSIYFRRCYENNSFVNVINSLIELLENASNNKKEFINSFENYNPELSEKTWKIIDESLDEMRNNDWNLEDYSKILFDLKLNIEKIFEVKVRNWKVYEETRYHYRNYIDIVTVEGYCGNCVLYISLGLKTREFIKSNIKRDDPKINCNNLLIFCPQCTIGNLDLKTYT